MEKKVETSVLSKLEIDLGGLEIEDIEVFAQEGSRAMPEFAASTGCSGWICSFNICSCAVNPVPESPSSPTPF